jgi:hypothetical protein
MSTPLDFLKQLEGSMSKENFNHENLFDHLDRYAYHGFAAAISMGADMGELPYQLREEVITRPVSHCFARWVAGSPGRVPGHSTPPATGSRTWLPPLEQARQASKI